MKVDAFTFFVFLQVCRYGCLRVPLIFNNKLNAGSFVFNLPDKTQSGVLMRIRGALRLCGRKQGDSLSRTCRCSYASISSHFNPADRLCHVVLSDKRYPNLVLAETSADFCFERSFRGHKRKATIHMALATTTDGDSERLSVSFMNCAFASFVG